MLRLLLGSYRSIYHQTHTVKEEGKRQDPCLGNADGRCFEPFETPLGLRRARAASRCATCGGQAPAARLRGTVSTRVPSAAKRTCVYQSCDTSCATGVSRRVLVFLTMVFMAPVPSDVRLPWPGLGLDWQKARPDPNARAGA